MDDQDEKFSTHELTTERVTNDLAKMTADLATHPMATSIPSQTPQKSMLKRASIRLAWIILAAASGVAILVLAAALIVGLTWFSAHALPWVQKARAITLLLSLFIFLPMLIFKRSRRLGATCLFFGSYVFGLACWLLSFILTLGFLGVFWLIIGLLLFGVGVFPMALIGCALHRAWPLFWVVLQSFGLMVAARLISGAVLRRYE